MQNEYFSDSHTGDSNVSLTHDEQATDTGFTITPQDTVILQQYLDEFQEADTNLRKYRSGARSLRRLWQSFISSGLKTHHLIRRRPARYVICVYMMYLHLIS
jgi:hypothetical protein